jgi:hypothetical protein
MQILRQWAINGINNGEAPSLFMKASLLAVVGFALAMNWEQTGCSFFGAPTFGMII